MSLYHWFEFSRPKTLVAAIVPVSLGTALAYSHTEIISYLYFILTLFASIFIQIGTNFANDYYDHKKQADTKERKGPKRALQQGIFTPQTVKISFILMFALAFFCGIFLAIRGGLPIVFIGVVSIILGIFYTKGKFALAYTGISDIFVILFFGPIAVVGTYYIQTLEVNLFTFLLGLCLGFLAVNLLVINNIRDYETDKKINKKTLTVRFGVKFSLLEVITSYMVSLSIPIYLGIKYNNKNLFFIFILLPFYIFLLNKILQYKKQNLNKLLSLHGLLYLLYGFLLLFFL